MVVPGDEAVAFEAVLTRMVEDSQERLILCTQKFIRDEIEGFSPAKEDLDYPAALLRGGNVAAPDSIYSTWFPTLERTLMCLSKIYRYVEVKRDLV